MNRGINDGVVFEFIEFNGQSMPLTKLSSKMSSKIKSKELLRYYVSDNDSLHVNYSISKNTPVNFTILEYSYDLLENPQFSMNSRTEEMMPKPFVVTDAVVVKKTIYVDSLKRKLPYTVIDIITEK